MFVTLTDVILEQHLDCVMDEIFVYSQSHGQYTLLVAQNLLQMVHFAKHNHMTD